MKKIFSIKVFLLFAFAVILITAIFIGVIYLSWLGDREDALDTLSKYKKLIDRTEELKEGQTYSYSQFDLSAKIVDIPTRIYDRNDEIIGEFFEQKREIIPYNNIPQWLVKAVISSEDRNFYNHKGLSYKGILRALLVDLKNLRVVQGGSTITQQLAKVLIYQSNEKYNTDIERFSIKRKIYEAFCAPEIEKLYDKQDILSMYLNLIYFGNGAYGVESAAKMFFGMSVKDLNETECAMIVATISSPKRYSPLQNLNNSLKRTIIILKTMIDSGFIENEQIAAYKYKKFLNKWDVTFDENVNPVSSLIGRSLYSSFRINRAPFFNESIRRVLEQRYGEDVLNRGGLSVYTTIDSARQDIALESLREAVKNQRDYHLNTAEGFKAGSPEHAAELDKAEKIEGALVAINPHTGEIIAYAGGYEFSPKSQLDHVRQILRQPGSSFKPLIYAASLEDKIITPSSVFIDEEKEFPGGYKPKNYNDTYNGKIIVREALRRSINIVAIEVLEETGYDTVFRYINDGLNLPGNIFSKRFQKTLSLALGAYEVSPLENCTLHSVLVNGGNFILPYGIRYVKDYNGNVVWNNENEVYAFVHEKRKETDKIIDPVACAVTVSMLKGVFEPGGTGYYAVQGYKIDFPIAGKTGTTNEDSDAWFLGYTSDLVTAVWIGNNAGAISLGKGRTGGGVAAPCWARFISRIYTEDNKPGDFPVPEGVTRQTICLVSGLVPRKGNLCPRIAVDELFYAGSEPGEYCNIHTGR